MYKVLLDFEKYLLSYCAFINPYEPHMTSQILSILIDF